MRRITRSASEGPSTLMAFAFSACSSAIASTRVDCAVALVPASETQRSKPRSFTLRVAIWCAYRRCGIPDARRFVGTSCRVRRPSSPDRIRGCRVCNRASSNAFCAPCRRPAGTVLAPASSAVPSWMKSAAVAIGWPSRSAMKQVAHSTLNLREAFDVRRHVGMFAPTLRRTPGVRGGFALIDHGAPQSRVCGDLGRGSRLVDRARSTIRPAVSAAGQQAKRRLRRAGRPHEGRRAA